MPLSRPGERRALADGAPLSDLKIHTHTASEAGLLVNSYLVETGEGIAVVDASLLNSEIEALCARVAGLGRPLLGGGATWIAPADPSLFTAQRQYLLHYRETVRRLAEGRPQLADAAQEELERLMTDYAPGLPLTWMIGLGADAVAAELAEEATPTAG